MKGVNKEIIAGGFFFVSLLFIILAVFLLGSKVGIGEARFVQHIFFNDVAGLKIGAPVRISGVTVGSVTDIQFLPSPLASGQGVDVAVSILSKYKRQLSEFSVYTIKTEGLLGDKLIDIQKGPPGYEPELTGDHIIGQDPLDLYNLADDFSKTTRYFNFLSSKMTELSSELQRLARSSMRAIERFEDKLIEGNLFSLFGPSREEAR